jgi:hypothetical protein
MVLFLIITGGVLYLMVGCLFFGWMNRLEHHRCAVEMGPIMLFFLVVFWPLCMCVEAGECLANKHHKKNLAERRTK